MASSGLAQAASLGFENIDGFAAIHGQRLVDGDYVIDGFNVTISTTGGVGDAQIFDTQDMTPGIEDTDLQQPLNVDTDAVYPINDSKVLIIAENNSDTNPDDAAGGGSILLTFDREVRFSGINLIDGEPGSNVINVLADGGVQVVTNASQGEREWETIMFQDAFRTKTIEVVFGGSGAFDALQITEVPVPAAGMLMLSALGGFAGVRRFLGA
ncbi:MAG: VPLPA-CTERM sorting domain-containing protein [Pseudomonadota bacterium]